MERQIEAELVEATRAWLSETGGLDFFKKMMKEYGEYSPVFNEGRIPHAVHFHEGMAVRNFMRGTGLCKDWGDHDFDDSWEALITKVME